MYRKNIINKSGSEKKNEKNIYVTASGHNVTNENQFFLLIYQLR